MSQYGQYHVAEPWHNLLLLHRHQGEPLRVVDHEPPLAVLDQQTLVAQDITVADVVPGARAGTDALGSCTANATTAAVSFLGTGPYGNYLEALGRPAAGNPFTDAKGGEEAAIAFYNRCTDQTGTPSTEWPPTDCGSSGPYIVQELQRLGIVSSQRIAANPQSLASLLQTGPVLEGTPFFHAWETPDPAGFVDGKGTSADLQAAIASGVAGGHETLITAIEHIALVPGGLVTPGGTVLRVRNSWGKAWGAGGSFRIHLSTLAALGHYCDFRQLVA